MFSEKEEKSILLEKQKNIYNLAAERTGEIEKLHSTGNFKKLK